MKKAWTMAEIAIAIVIILIISGICTTIFKPNIQKAKFYMYAAVNNIKKGNNAILEKNIPMEGEDVEGNEWYCMNLADQFNLDTAANCTKTTTSGDMTVNITFPNGVTIIGLASAWVEPYTGAAFKYKNILIDIDGPSNGNNKIWVDRFPMRIISGSGKGVNGYIMPVNCKNDVVYNSNQKKDVSVDNEAKNPYCPTTGAKNYGLDDKVLMYDIYRRESKEEGAKTLVLGALYSPMQADCLAYGGKIGYYSVEECANAGFKILPECAIKNDCDSYITDDNAYNTFPKDSTTVATCKTVAENKNEDGVSCLALIHRPSGGMSFFMQAMIGDIDKL